MISISEIKEIFKGRVTLNEPLAPFTTFRIGGMADYYVEPCDEPDLMNIVRYVEAKEIPFYMMGNGSNVLISDDGIRGVVINLEMGFSYMRLEGAGITVGAGVKLAKFVDFAIQNRFAGVEMLAGIPATIGGALVMNAGAYGGWISQHVDEVRVIRKGEVKVFSRDECGFGYRTSKLRDTVVMQGKFSLPPGDPVELSNKRKVLMLKRNEVQPVDIPNAGSVFKNPEGDYAARLIEECGLKGARSGGAMVSPKHANFIVNFDRANAVDVIELIKKIKQTVREKKGVELQLEVKLIGFEELTV